MHHDHFFVDLCVLSKAKNCSENQNKKCSEKYLFYVEKHKKELPNKQTISHHGKIEESIDLSQIHLAF